MTHKTHTYTRQCAHNGCPERSFIEYTARRDLDGVPAEWKCYRHDKVDEVLSADNPTTTAVLTLHPSYTTSRWDDEPPKLVGYFWGPEDANKGHRGIVSGPGFRAVAEDFPPGARLIVTARIEFPAVEDSEEAG